jgi:hypothetical protein
MTDFIIVALTALSTFAAVWGTIIYPRSKEKKATEAKNAKEQAERDEDVDGIVSASGEVVVPRLTLRVKAVETEMKKVTAGQSLLEQRMDEANGTGKATRAAVEEIRNFMAQLATKADVKTEVGVVAQVSTKNAENIVAALHE